MKCLHFYLTLTVVGVYISRQLAFVAKGCDLPCISTGSFDHDVCAKNWGTPTEPDQFVERFERFVCCVYRRKYTMEAP